MGFGRFRKLFRREPTRQELYLRLTRGLNIERDYQSWIESWEMYGPAGSLPTPSLPLVLALFGTPSPSDREYWTRFGREIGAVQVAWTEGPTAVQHAFNVVANAPRTAAEEYVAFL